MSYDVDEVTEKIDFPWLIFKLNNNMYTVNSKLITTIVIMPDEVTFVPNVAKHLTGLIHLRGNVVPLINLRALFGIESGKETVDSEETNKMVIVLEKENFLAGLIVDEVLSVENITSFEETEETKKLYKNSFVKGVAKGKKSNDVFLILDVEKIMNMS